MMLDIQDDSESTDSITCSKQIFNRPRYAGPLRLESAEKVQVVAPYDLPRGDWVRCGLNGCTTEHGKGYVIRAEDGRETNCGHMCGSREFGAVFEEFVADFQRRKVDQARRAVLTAAQTEAAPMLSTVEALVPQLEENTDRVWEIMDVITRDPDVSRKFHEILRLGGRVSVEERISEDIRKATGSAARFTTRTIATIEGGRSALDGGRPLQTIKQNVLPGLRRLLSLNLQEVSPDDGDKLSLEIAEIRRQIQRAQQYIEDAHRFTSLSNLRAVALLGEVMANRSTRASRALRALDRLIEEIGARQ
ncbi:hypothetical protein ACSBPU_05685 [Parapusillimonas sp. JC17]|uniref:hypothetical protein n=1 Tax=Parapusillimonas sp. JC17 TaxID=3445768 RepID=UPI003FA16CAA